VPAFDRLQIDTEFIEQVPFTPGKDAVMSNGRPRRVVLRDSRYPGGCGLLLAWDCDHERLNGFGRFLFRTGREFVIQSTDPRIPFIDQVSMVDDDKARAMYQRLSVKVIPEDNAFASRSSVEEMPGSVSVAAMASPTPLDCCD
jgi:hypothetical protein